MDNTRQQIVDSINANTNILVTVSTDPTVDELSAALGLSILLNNLDKRASAVFSGKIPKAINFLEPDKTFENTADSLRDFIIALDKEKADHLRYKVDGDVVKIFITPYRTTLSQKDLDFSQGDYNVELVIAIGVKDQDHLDKALAAHGKILHDATVVTITAGTDASSLGSIDWHDQMASSLGEMMVSLADGLKTDKPLLDEQIATAFLTGIVSATDRFSNDRTSSRVMTMAAQLMAAGANQQLIAAKLAEAHDIGPGPVAGKQSAPIDAPAEKTEQPEKKPQNSNELSIDRQSKKSKKSKQKDDAASEAAALAEPALDNPTADVVPGEKELEAQIAASAPPPVAQSMADIEQALQDATDQLGDESSPKPEATSQDASPSETTIVSTDENTETAPAPEPTQEPVQTQFSPAPPQPGLAFEPAQQPEQTQPIATPETAPAPEPELPPLPPLPDFSQPAQTPSPAQEPSMIINDHGSFSAQPPSTSQPLNSFTGGPAADEAPIDPFAAPVNQVTQGSADDQPAQQTTAFEPVPAPTVPIDSPQFGTPEGAAQLGAMPATTAPVDSSVSGQAQSPEIPSLPPLPPLPPLPTDGSLPPLPPPPTAPDFSQPANSLSGAVSGDVFGDASAAPAAEPTSPAPEPGQYRIPGQG